MHNPVLRQRLHFGPRQLAVSGVVICAAIAWLSMLAGNATGIPPVLLALIAGAALAHRFDVAPLGEGVNFTVRTILRAGIALIGVRLSVAQIAELGISTVLVAAGGVLLMLSAGTVIAMAFGLPRGRSILSAGAVGICGASAALAISTVLPPHPAQERQTVTTVALVTALSTAAMLIYPLIGRMLGLGQLETGIFFGASIHDVTQVAGAGAMVSPATTTAAVATKLVRVSCLAPVVAAILFLGARRGVAAADAGAPPAIPVFLVGFALIAAAANFGLLPPALRGFLSASATFCLVAATAALGMKTSLRLLLAEGWRPLAAMTAQTLLLAAYVIGCIFLFKM
ncbi:YeiH family protein [Sphingobium indicum]|nr:putative sulfate exporter family transporter [Sphingobium indicum]NYI23597.1 putative integral membrane protein (TIGR00698 family) [Sphingobium indicum]